MSLTKREICVIIKSRLDVEEVVDLLDISVDDLLDHFDHKIDENWDYLQEELEDV